MVVTVGAINKKDVQPLQGHGKDWGREAHRSDPGHAPILIVDEPQSVDGAFEGQGKRALGEMNPLCTLRYSPPTPTNTTCSTGWTQWMPRAQAGKADRSGLASKWKAATTRPRQADPTSNKRGSSAPKLSSTCRRCLV